MSHFRLNVTTQENYGHVSESIVKGDFNDTMRLNLLMLIDVSRAALLQSASESTPNLALPSNLVIPDAGTSATGAYLLDHWRYQASSECSVSRMLRHGQTT